MKPGGPKLENLIVIPGSQEREDPALVLAHGLSAGAAPMHATVLDSYREWVAQSGTDQDHPIEMGYAMGSVSVVEVYKPRIRAVTIEGIADSFTHVYCEHSEVPPQLAAPGAIIELQADKPAK